MNEMEQLIVETTDFTPEVIAALKRGMRRKATTLFHGQWQLGAGQQFLASGRPQYWIQLSDGRTLVITFYSSVTYAKEKRSRLRVVSKTKYIASVQAWIVGGETFDLFFSRCVGESRDSAQKIGERKQAMQEWAGRALGVPVVHWSMGTY